MVPEDSFHRPESWLLPPPFPPACWLRTGLDKYPRPLDDDARLRPSNGSLPAADLDPALRRASSRAVAAMSCTSECRLLAATDVLDLPEMPEADDRTDRASAERAAADRATDDPAT